MAPRPIMEGRPWWPSGIAQSHDESVIYTKWGTTALHVPEISKEWWEDWKILGAGGQRLPN